VLVSLSVCVCVCVSVFVYAFVSVYRVNKIIITLIRN
jgi:hypothetical protein